MVVTLRLLTKEGAYLSSRAKSMARALDMLPGKTITKHAIVDGFLITASKAGKRLTARIMDLPLILIGGESTFDVINSAVSPVSLYVGRIAPDRSTVKTTTSLILVGQADFSTVSTIKWFMHASIPFGAATLLAPRQQGEGSVANYSDIRPSFATWVRPDGSPFFLQGLENTIHSRHYSVGTGTPFNGGFLYNSAWVLSERRLLLPRIWRTTELPFGTGGSNDGFFKGVTLAHVVNLETKGPAQRNPPTGKSMAGLALTEDYYRDTLGVELECRARRPEIIPEGTLILGETDIFELQPPTWGVSCPLYPITRTRAHFVLIAHCVLDQFVTPVDAIGRRGLAVTVANGVYDSEAGATNYQLSNELVSPSSLLGQAPQKVLTKNGPVGGNPPIPLDQWLFNGYQPSAVASFLDGQIIAIHRQYSIIADNYHNDAKVIPAAGTADKEQLNTSHQSVHVSGALIGEAGQVAVVDIVPPGSRYTPNPTSADTVFYDGLLGVDTDKKNQAVAVALAFYPGWMALQGFTAGASDTFGTGTTGLINIGDHIDFNADSRSFFNDVTLDSNGNQTHNPPRGSTFEPPAGTARSLSVTVFSRKDGWTATTTTTSTNLYPLREARLFNSWGLRPGLGAFVPYVPNFNSGPSAAPSTIQGVTYIGRSNYVFLAASDVEGFRRVCVVYSAETGQFTVKRQVFNSAIAPLRTSAARINCLSAEKEGDDAVLLSSHADRTSWAWASTDEDGDGDRTWVHAINNQGNRRGAAAQGITFISHDSGWTWTVLATVGSFPGLSVVPLVPSRGFPFETQPGKPDPEDEEQ